ncbi:MAG TPA: sulfurtransferase [Solirubrobacteraceae bacterium]|nr:sulfurtransferase [Solirubrobacteraceae bacterium]
MTLVSDIPAGATVLDVRWELGWPPGAGRERYLEEHIPGAAFVDLETALAGPPGEGGRHPLPEAGVFGSAMRAAGVSAARPVVVYDGGDLMAAARAWWLLRYFGHSRVFVLDGGFGGWLAAGRAIERGAVAVGAGDFEPRPGGMPLLDAAGAARVAAGAGVLLDARAVERYVGASEPVDPVAGHIPGAVNVPGSELLRLEGGLLDPEGLRARFEAAGVRDGVEVGAYCGSGVTAALEVLALSVAGFDGALYVGSWSDWVRDPSRPVATGEPG